jgi:hypothetical protein
MMTELERTYQGLINWYTIKSMSKIKENKERAEEIRKCASLILDMKNDCHALQTVDPSKIKQLREQLEKAKTILDQIKKPLNN